MIERIRNELHTRYKNGDRESNRELKAILQSLYDRYGLKRIATATQITEFGFATKRCKIATIDEKGIRRRIDGVILLTY